MDKLKYYEVTKIMFLKVFNNTQNQKVIAIENIHIVIALTSFKVYIYLHTYVYIYTQTHSHKLTHKYFKHIWIYI